MEQRKGRTRRARLEVRTTTEDRRLIDEAVAARRTGLTEFVLDLEAQEAWEELNRRSARDLPGLREFMARSSPFADE